MLEIDSECWAEAGLAVMGRGGVTSCFGTASGVPLES
jgi:hypothetical protein